MVYSAATASLSIGGAVILLPHFVLGMVFLVFGLRGKAILRGVKSKLGLLVQIPVGILFLGVAVWSVTNGIAQTHRCRTAEANGDFVSVSGPVRIVKRFAKPSYGYVEFTVGERALRTYESGLSCDCGYILPVGKTLRIQDGMLVEAKAHGTGVIALKLTSSGS